MEAPLRARVEGLLHHRIESARPAAGGYTHAARWIVTLDDGRTAYVKAATDESTARWLHREIAFYGSVSAPFLAEVVATDASPSQPILVLEDLSHAHWPPPWDDRSIARARETLDAIAAVPPPTHLAPAEADMSDYTGWKDIAADPAPFLSLGLATAGWLERALPVLLAAESNANFAGDALLHHDFRSDNLCLLPDRVVVVDWNFANIGNPVLDLAAWLPSLHSEGGPLPETLLPDSQGFSALWSGYFASRAGLPVIPHAPLVRDVQRTQALSALPWAARELRLPPLDGPNAPSL